MHLRTLANSSSKQAHKIDFVMMKGDQWELYTELEHTGVPVVGTC